MTHLPLPLALQIPLGLGCDFYAISLAWVIHPAAPGYGVILTL